MRHKTPESLAKVIVEQTSGMFMLISVVVHNYVQSLSTLLLQCVAIKPDAAKGLLLHILGDEDAQSASNYLTIASNVLTLLAKEFNTTQVNYCILLHAKTIYRISFQDELKFVLCDVLYTVLSLSGETLVRKLVEES